MHVGRRPAWLVLLLLGACGGGGGGTGAPPAPVVVELGAAAATQPTVYSRTFTNPLGSPATVTEPSPSGAFAVAGLALPVAVGAGGSVTLPVVLTPPGPGLVEGTVTVRFSAGATTAEVSESYRAAVETLSVTVAPPAVAFGTVQPSSSADRVVRITNASALSPITFANVTTPHPDVSVVTPLPLLLAPGGGLDVTLRLASAAGDPVAGLVRLGMGEPGGPVDVQVSGNAGLSEVVTDFGNVTFSGGQTPVLLVNVPANAISLSLEAIGAQGSLFGLGELVGPGGVVYENTSSTGAYIWMPGDGVFTTHVPNTDRTDVQLVAGGGTYGFRIRRLSGGATTVRVRAIVERRDAGAGTTGVLPLNVWLAQGLPVDAASAPTDARLQAILGHLDTILGGQGVSVGDITYYDVGDPAFDAVSDAEFPQLLALTTGAAEHRLNLFFVQQTLSGGVIGVAGTIGGPRVNGTTVSGVMSIYDSGFSAATVGLVAAHEIGHFLALFHTVEQSGDHDFVDDTLECPASSTNATCPTLGGGYLMHWQAVGGTTITPGQGLVLRGHALVEATPPGSPKPRRPALPPGTAAEMEQARSELSALATPWCGTCSRCQRRVK